MEEKLGNIGLEIRRIVFEWEEKLKDIPEGVLLARLNRQGRNIKQLIGHMIDSASNNHQRMVRLQYISNLNFPDYTHQNDMWISIQQHQQANWDEMLQLWKYFNLHIAHIISHTDKSWLNNMWSDGTRDPICLEDMIYDYLAHLRLHMSEIKQLIEQQS